MFGFLKKGLKNIADKIGKEADVKEAVEEDVVDTKQEVEEDVVDTKQEVEEDVVDAKQEVEEKKIALETIQETKPTETLSPSTVVETAEIKEKELKTENKTAKEPKQKRGLFDSLKKLSKTFSTVTLSEEKFEKVFWELEITLLENNIAVEVIEKIKEALKHNLVDKEFSKKELEKTIQTTLTQTIREVLTIETFSLIDEAKKKKPFVILLAGINGSGKTTTAAKLAHLFKKNNLVPVLAAADTFRAAAIQQLQKHAEKLDVKLIKHDYGSDPAAVAFDAIKYAEAHKADVVLIDTAGRLHSNTNLMAEIAKVVRVAQPDIKLFVGESITGNDCIEQARLFNETIALDGVILSKADVDERGGTAISISYVIKKPILYLGTGQDYDALQPFSAELVLNALELS